MSTNTEFTIEDQQSCTCCPIQENDHDFDCDLWKSPGWRAGLLVWDSKHEILVADDAGYYSLTDEELAEFAEIVGGDLLEEKIDTVSKERADQLWDESVEEMSGVTSIGDKAKDAFKKLRDSAKAKPKKDKKKAKAKPKWPECDCQPKDKKVDLRFSHYTTCDLSRFVPWIEQDCEWDHEKRRFLWYDEDETPGKDAPSLTKPPHEIGEGDILSDKKASTTGGNSAGFQTWQKCRHYEQAVKFPDGTTVYASSRHDRKATDSRPDMGLYLDPSWRPASVATFIPWRDHGLPAIRWDHAVDVIVDAYAQAREGWTVEVGCIGGHGRTGTVLACMAVLAGVSPDQACSWVWEHYCKEAIESDDQIWWVYWFAAKVLGYPEPLPPVQLRTSAEPPPPPKPVKSTAKTTTSGNVTKPSGEATAKTRAAHKKAPVCRDCNTPRSEASTFLCDNSKCRPNYTQPISSPKGEKKLDEWEAAAKKDPPLKVVKTDEHVPNCLACGTPRTQKQEYLCDNSRCKPASRILSNSPRGITMLEKWAAKTAAAREEEKNRKEVKQP